MAPERFQSYFLSEFQDLVTCRGETEESLKKKFGISPSTGPKTHKVCFGSKSVRYLREDIMKAVEHWRSAGKDFKDHQGASISIYSMSWMDLKRLCKKR